MVKRIYGRRRHLGTQRKSRKCRGLGKKIRKGIQQNWEGKEKENYWVSTQRRCCMDRMTRDSMKNIGDNWKEIGTNGRERERSTKKRKKKKLRKEE